MKIFTVIPVHNRKNLTRNCLFSLYKQTYRNFEVIVVDDGSTDRTSEMIQKEFPEVILLKGDGNLWWTGAINKGIRYVLKLANDSDYVLVLNDDVELPRDYIGNVFKTIAKEPNALIGSVTVNVEDPNIIDNGGIIQNWITVKNTVLNRGRSLSEFDEDTFFEVSILTGRGVVIPIRVFKEIGLYDEKHFQQCGDTEFAVRANRKGCKLIINYSMIVKSHSKSTDSINTAEKYRLKDTRKYFFGVKSNTRLKYRFYFALKTAKNPFIFLIYFFFDMLRVGGHFLRRLSL